MAQQPAPTSRAEAQQQTRRDLIEAAGQVFLEKGFAGASLTDIVERAGYTKGAVYSNFRSKEDLALAILVESSDRETDDLVEHLATLVRERAYWVELAKTNASDVRALLTLELSTTARHNEELRARLVQGRRSMIDSMAGVLAGDGQPTRAHHEAVTLINAMLSGVAMQYALDPDRRLVELFGEFAVQTIIGLGDVDT